MPLFRIRFNEAAFFAAFGFLNLRKVPLWARLSMNQLCTPVGILNPTARQLIARVKTLGRNEPRDTLGRCTASVVSCAVMAALVSAMTLSAESARAAPDEIRVITDDLPDRGGVSLELHAASVRARRGETTQHLAQGLAEISYGVSETVGVSVQLPFSKEPGWRANGVNFELQYIAPHDLQNGLYLGVRVELGRVRSPFESRTTPSIELRPIVGYRVDGWHSAFNLAMRTPLSGVERKLAYEPAAKVARDVSRNTQLGVEYYSQAPQQADGADGGLARRRLALLVVDTKIQGVALSFGVGRGIGPAADGPVVKLIAGFEL